jgi:hypothetical protein
MRNARDLVGDTGLMFIVVVSSIHFVFEEANELIATVLHAVASLLFGSDNKLRVTVNTLLSVPPVPNSIAY